jgi:O-antigen/teichoic acid export membrane protein
VRGHFGRIVFASLLKNLVRIGTVAPFLSAAEPNARAAALAICAGAVLSFAATVPFISWDFLRRGSPMRPAVAEIQRLSGWMVLCAISSFGGRLDVWIVGWLSNAHEAGLYALAAQLCAVTAIINQALVTAFLPTISRLHKFVEMKGFMWRWLRCLPLFPVIVGIVWHLSGPVIRLIFGEAYASSALTFNILFTASMVTLMGSPLTLFLFTVGETRIFAASNLVQLALRVTLAISIVPLAGAAGMASAEIASRFLTIALMGYFIWLALRRAHEQGTT